MPSQDEVFYHYTTPRSLEGIVNSRVIKRSEKPDLECGPGVYLTKLDPTAGRERIVTNNWDGTTSSISVEDFKKTKSAIKLTLDRSKVRYGHLHGRDVWIHDEDLNLSEVKKWSVVFVGDNSFTEYFVPNALEF